MIFAHTIFKDQPLDILIQRLHCPAVTTRQQYLSQCKARALAILATGDRRGAVDSMLHDMAYWEGGKLYSGGELEMRRAEVTFYANSANEVRDWINDFF